MSANLAESVMPDNAAFAMRLARNIKGEVLFDRASRGRYSTDASIYQVDPVGVIVPETIDDVVAAMSIARDEGVAVLPRGGGTSQCGQTVNRALVIDCSKRLRRVLHVDAEARTALVEPGLVLGHLNNALRAQKLFFPVDPSTHARCTIGGMAGNNSCGSKSIRYGLMADNVRSIEAVLSDGTQHRFGAIGDNLGERMPATVADLIQRLRVLGASEADEIAARFPRQLRRVGGYNIDALTPAARGSGRDNLARLLVGSEGTLAFSAAIELMLHPIKPRKVLGICQFPTFRKAMEASRHIVALEPEAVELVDRTMIDLGRGIPIYRATIDQMLLGEPNSLLIVEFHGDADAPLLAKLAELEELMGELGHPGVVRAVDPALQADIAAVREAGLNIMMSMKGDAKPVSFIEDCAVDLDDLADYTERLNEVFERHGTKGTWYAHASVGCLHVRPVLNMKDPNDVARMRSVAEEAFALVREYKGSHSGEHGDGLARSEFHDSMFGSRMVRAFEAVKDAFDPIGLMNPNRITQPARMDDRTLFRYSPGYGTISDFIPKLDWSEHPGALGGMLGAVEMCNNNGTCRGFDAGVMCPSYRVTRDEVHLTRGRANTLRLALTGQLGADAMASDPMAEAMALCVSCKACKRECPTGVDMAKMKLEVSAARADRHGVKWRETLIAELPRYAPLVSQLSMVANLRNHLPPLRWLTERVLGLSATRRLPRWRADKFLDKEAVAVTAASPRGEVYLLADTFNRYFEPENLRAALKLLAAAGYRVVMPNTGGRPLCCGRTWLAVGMLDKAREEAARTMRYLPLDLPIVGLEPSCLMTLRDEFRSLLPGAETDRFALRALLLSEFIARQKPALPLRPMPGTVRVHGHCHQKAFGAFPDALAMLRLIPKLSALPIASSCCGMAGAFGYQAETQAASRAMAEADLLPAVRAAAAHHYIVADGTSCRHQIRDLAGREAIHSVRLMERALEAG
ncbi:FAD-binding and (Fe-S)-binding domain-containing protein [Rhodopila sp.]|uniref:FAD-binding and (Fe-S)-binding domain-containing protein n=1 Tax=Rhodopila sp. TaxID=2480087 RepID=UPI003D0B474F